MGKSTQSLRAFAYLRTSSAANIGEDKDSGRRQVQAIETYSKRAGIELVDTYHDEAVKGSDPIDTRPGFAAMLEALEANGIKTIIVETANRFARDLMVQEVGYAMLRARGIDLIAADSPTSFLDDTPTARLIRQVLGASLRLLWASKGDQSARGVTAARLAAVVSDFQRVASDP